MLASFALEKIKALQPDTVYVGLSGGVDSVVLLKLAVERFGDQVRAIHIHHGLLDEAAAFEAAASAACEALDVVLISRRVDVSRSGSLEANARARRYEVFEEIVGSNEVLLLAHHRDDQVETILHTLFRGSGRFGVSGMPRERRLGRGYLLRPLIESSRDEILRYARRHDLAWVEDPSNADLTHVRNAIRHAVLPALEAQWPDVRDTLLRAMARDDAYRQVIDSEMENAFSLVRRGAGVDVMRLVELTPARRSMLIRYWIDLLGLPQPAGRALDQGLYDLLSARDDSAPLLGWQTVCLRRYRGQLFLGSNADDQPPAVTPIETPSTFFGPGRLTLFEARSSPCLIQRDDYVAQVRTAGMTLIRRHRRSLKKLMQEAGVPPWLRDRIPIVCCGDVVAALPALPDWGVPMIVADEFAPKEGEPGWSVAFNLPGEPYSA